jgi:hypothetical protein
VACTKNFGYPPDLSGGYLNLSNSDVIASQCAHWRGNPLGAFPEGIFCFFRVDGCVREENQLERKKIGQFSYLCSIYEQNKRHGFVECVDL